MQWKWDMRILIGRYAALFIREEEDWFAVAATLVASFTYLSLYKWYIPCNYKN
jgi:arginine exporter protein ArgO